MDKLIEHHIKYKEIHGTDETVWMTRSEHKKLHNRLRREGKCKIPANVLTEIARRAHHRTEKRQKINRSEQERVRKRLYKITHKEQTAKYNRNYKKTYEQNIDFYATIAPYTQVVERIVYNTRNGTVRCVSRFINTNGKLSIIRDAPGGEE